MTRFKKISVLSGLLIVSALILFCISGVQTKINGIIEEKKLRDSGSLENAPPIVAFTTMALGSFRGILADILWLRTIELQDSGNYYEMVQLASMITKLQPRFTGATAYLAWNMAYNISVTCSDHEDRWRWVQSGIKLIRDEALEYNPADPTLYKELGWIYQHKVGNIMDDANYLYKNKMAVQYMKVFGKANPDWAAFAKAPKTIEAFEKSMPKDSPFWAALKKADYKNLATLIKVFKIDGTLPEDFEKALNNKEIAQKVTDFIRAYWLRTTYKLDPVVINDINKKYGLLDWRLPEAHAIYWATQGLLHSREKADLACERMITQALHDAFMRGRLLMVDDKGFKDIMTIPNFDVTDAVLATYDEAYKKNESSSFKSAKVNFMKNALVLFYDYGDYTKAKEFLKLLRKEEPGNPIYNYSVDVFAQKELLDDIKNATPNQANGIIVGKIYQSCYFLAMGDFEAAAAQEKQARIMYYIYEQEQKDAWERMGLTSFKMMKEKVIENLLKTSPEAFRKRLNFQLEQLKLQAEEKKKSGKD